MITFIASCGKSCEQDTLESLELINNTTVDQTIDLYIVYSQSSYDTPEIKTIDIKSNEAFADIVYHEDSYTIEPSGKVGNNDAQCSDLYKPNVNLYLNKDLKDSMKLCYENIVENNSYTLIEASSDCPEGLEEQYEYYETSEVSSNREIARNQTF